MKCDICDEEFPNSEALKAHRERDHPMGEESKEPELEKPDFLADDSESEPEQPEPIVRPSGRGWNQVGMHHVDAHYIGEGGWLASVDGYRHAWTFGIRRWPNPSGPAP